MIDSEIFLYFALSILFFYLLNMYMRIRTAASFFIAIFFSSIICYGIYKSIISEGLIMFSILIAVIYSLAKGFRDKRDDNIKIFN